jgi:hypothetical protein
MDKLYHKWPWKLLVRVACVILISLIGFELGYTAGHENAESEYLSALSETTRRERRFEIKDVIEFFQEFKYYIYSLTHWTLLFFSCFLLCLRIRVSAIYTMIIGASLATVSCGVPLAVRSIEFFYGEFDRGSLIIHIAVFLDSSYYLALLLFSLGLLWFSARCSTAVLDRPPHDMDRE